MRFHANDAPRQRFGKLHRHQIDIEMDFDVMLTIE